MSIGLALGLGLGLGLDNSNRANNSDSTTTTLSFDTIDVNTQIGRVLAVNSSNSSINFANLTYVQSTNSKDLTLETSNNESAGFTVSVGGSATVANGYNLNQHLYIPIEDSTIANANYLRIEGSSSNDGNTDYLYVDGVGFFDSNNVFQEEFSAINLVNSPKIDITFNLGNTPDVVPQPSNPVNSQFNFTTNNISNEEGNILNVPLFAGDDVSNFIYLNSSDPATIIFTSMDNNNFDTDLTMLTDSSNPAKFFYNQLFIPIDPITYLSIQYDYVSISIVFNNSNPYWTIRYATKEANSNSNLLSFVNLANLPTAELGFSKGN